MKVHNTEPTRITKTTATCLDLIGIDKTIKCLQYKVGNESVSDHLPVTAILEVKPEGHVKPILKRSFRKVDPITLGNRLSSIKLPDSTCVNTLVEDWEDQVIIILDEVAPVKQFPLKKSRSRFIDPETREIIKEKLWLVKKIKKSSKMQNVDKQEISNLTDRLKIAKKESKAGSDTL